MAGIINDSMQQPGAAAPAAQPGGGQPAPQADKKSVERVVLAAMKIIHDPKVFPQIIQLMKGTGDPVSALVKATLLVMRQIYEKSQNSVPPDVLGVAGVEVMNEIALIAMKHKLYNITPEIFREAVNVALEQAKQGGDMPAGQPAGQPAGAAAPAPAAEESVEPEEETEEPAVEEEEGV